MSARCTEWDRERKRDTDKERQGGYIKRKREE
jgi:hypothetical protein